MSKLFSALMSLSMLGLCGVANATESVTLTDTQMDGVTAGVVVSVPDNQAAVHNPNGLGSHTPGSDDFISFIHDEPEGGGNVFANGRYHNHYN